MKKHALSFLLTAVFCFVSVLGVRAEDIIKGSFKPITDEILNSEQHRALYSVPSRLWLKSVTIAGKPVAEVWSYLAFESAGTTAALFTGQIATKITKDALFKVANEYVLSSPENICKDLASSMMSVGMDAYERNYERYKVWKKTSYMSPEDRIAFKRDNYISNYLGYGRDLLADIKKYKHGQGNYSRNRANQEVLVKEIASVNKSASTVVWTLDKLKSIVNMAKNDSLSSYPPYQAHIRRIISLEKETGVELSLGKIGGDADNISFYEDAKNHIKSGAPFSALYSNFGGVVLIEEDSPNSLFAVVDYSNGGGRRFYRAYIFEFPLNKEVVAKIDEVGTTMLSGKKIREDGILSLGLIYVIELSTGRGNPAFVRSGAYLTKNNGWEFDVGRRSSNWLVVENIIADIYTPNPNLRKNYLGKMEIAFIQDPGALFVRDNITSSYDSCMEALRRRGYLFKPHSQGSFVGEWGEDVSKFKNFYTNGNFLTQIPNTNFIEEVDVYRSPSGEVLLFYNKKLYSAQYVLPVNADIMIDYIKDKYKISAKKYINSAGKEVVKWEISDNVYLNIKKSSDGEKSAVGYFYKPIADLVLKISSDRRREAAN